MKTNYLATAALVLGVVALAYPAAITGPPAAVAAIGLGVVGLWSQRRRTAIGGIACGTVALVLFVTFTLIHHQAENAIGELLADSPAIPATK